MKKAQQQLSRKRFLLWGSGLVSMLAASRLFTWFGRSPKPHMVKMLSQEGQLVEVDISKVIASHKKIKEAELHTWVNHKKNLKR